MKNLSHLQPGLERIAVVISTLSCLWITGLLLTHFQLVVLIMKPYGITSTYFTLYVLALVIPQLLVQLILWIASAFKGINYKFYFNPKLLAITTSIIIGLALSGILIVMTADWLFTFSEGIATAILLLDCLIAGGFALYLHKRISRLISARLSR